MDETDYDPAWKVNNKTQKHQNQNPKRKQTDTQELENIIDLTNLGMRQKKNKVWGRGREEKPTALLQREEEALKRIIRN